MYDCIIIGCGPAGMTAAVYLARAGKKVLILEKETIGGQISSSPKVENYPGFIEISGTELSNNMYEQIMKYDVDIEIEEVTKIVPGIIKTVITDSAEYETKSIIIAVGTKHRLLGLDNEEELIGNGIHFCVSCDGSFYKDKVVGVVGGGNSGIIDAIYLADIAKKVYVFQNLDYITAEQNLIDQLSKKQNVEIMLSTKVMKYNGSDELTGVDVQTEQVSKTIDLDGLFLAIGLLPQNDFLEEVIELDDRNYVISFDTKTNVDGIYVAGDCRTKEFRQVTTATNDGTIAANNVINYLNSVGEK